MEPLNGYLHVKPLKQGMISSTEGNEYEVVVKSSAPLITDSKPGDIVIVEDNLVVKVNVNGEEQHFVREENLLARIPSDPGNANTESAQT